jgi:hypothetical protein
MNERELWVYTLLAALVVVVGFGVVAALTSTGAITAGDGGQDVGTDLVAISLTRVMLAQLLIGVLGVLVITADYSTGIRSTFAAVHEPSFGGFGSMLVSRPARAAFGAVALALGGASLAFGVWYATAAWSLAPYPL